MTTHLFVAPGSAAFGEVLLGMRLAHELTARGDRVLFLAPAAHELVFAGSPFAHGHIDKILGVLDRALPDVIRDRQCDTVVLLDLLVTLLALASHRIDPRFLDHLGVPTYALDIWDLRNTDLRFDMCDAELRVPELARTIVPQRLLPVPFARLDSPGAYCALPETSPVSAEARARVRAELGIAGPLVLLTTARYQAQGFTPAQRELVATVPAAIARACHDAGAHLLHVGTQPIDGGPRYRFIGQLPPGQFHTTLGAADLLVTPNQAATGISTALALGVPALAVIRPPVFRVLPIGLYHFMSPILQDNPYADAIATCEEPELVRQLQTLLFDSSARTARLEIMRSYVARVRSLPCGGKLIR